MRKLATAWTLKKKMKVHKKDKQTFFLKKKL